VTYEWNDTDNHGVGVNIGFIAQEVKEVLPEVVTGSEETNYSMTYAPITALLVEAIKELKNENDALRARLEQIEKLIQEK
jgi:hypothetical protein